MSDVPDRPTFSEHEPLGAASSDLEQFGYKQELRRDLGFASTFSAAFSYMSPTTGIFGVFVIGFAALGGGMIWGWPLVFLGQLFVALGFAEMSSHYPLAGSVFQWTKFLSPSKGYTWNTSWIYLWAGALTTAAVIATMPVVLIPLLAKMGWNLAGTTGQQQAIAALTLVVCLLLNVFGVKIATAVNNFGVAFELLSLVVFAVILAVFHHHHGVSVVTDTGGHGFSLGGVGLALFVGLWVMYGMDTASTLAEEAKSPRTIAPRAVIISLVGAFATGGIFLLALLLAVPGSIGKAAAAGLGPVQIIEANLPAAWSTVYLVIINIAVFVTCVAIMTSLIRLVFGMARDGQLPLSGRYSGVSKATGTPIGASIVAALVSGVFLLQYKSAGIVAIAATAATYVAYLLANLALFRARRRGWPHAKAPFRLGRWGMPVTVIAIVFEVVMLVNLFWPRAATNPSPNQTGGALNLGVGWLNAIPVDWTVLAAVIVAGLVYYRIRRDKIRDPRQVPAVATAGSVGQSADPLGAGQ
jgi:amino acid transporter